MHPRRVVDHQSLAALAFPHLVGRQREFVLTHRSDFTVADARAVLARGDGPLRAAFNTSRREQQLRAAVGHVDSAVRAWVEGHRRDVRFRWIVPPRLVGGLSKGSYTPTLMRRLERTKPGRRLLASCVDLHIWLPQLSIEAVHALRRFRAPDHPKLQVAIAHLAKASGSCSEARPWRTRFPVRSAALPASALYQFRPEQRTAVLLTWLATSGLVNVGHLAALHPEAIQQIERLPPAAWHEIHLALSHRTETAG